jgi:uncharacterized protein (TIGR02596 family)
MKSNPKRTNTLQAFTLIELMVVIAVVALLMAAMAPMVFSTLASSKLTAAGETLAAQISYARQRAVSANEEIEVRFYAYDDPELPGTEVNYLAMAVVKVTIPPGSTGSAGGIPVGQVIGDVYYLPTGIALGRSNALSPAILSTGASNPESPDRENVIRKATATFRGFRFLPDGSSNLPPTPARCYVTLVEERYAGAQSEIPKNFFAIQIDPANGRTTTYRP